MTPAPARPDLIITSLLVIALIIISLIQALFLLPLSQATAQQPPARKLEQNGLKLELAPLPPDTVRAFFMGRGFGSKHADHLVATGCVFRSAIGSSRQQANAPPVTTDLAQWRILRPGRPAAVLKTREQWQEEWRQRGLDEDARVAFYWALFPTRQTFAAGDYNWGMLTFALPPGSRFDLKLVWQENARTREALMKDLTCAN